MTVEEMTETLDRLGIEVIGTRGYEVQAACPAHKERTGHEDRNPSWYINADTGAHICFSCGWKGNLYTVISYAAQVDYDKAQEWLGSPASLTARLNRVVAERPEQVFEEPTRISEAMLSAFTIPPDYALTARGLSPSAVSRYSIKWDERNKHWIIPIRDPRTDLLLGWQEKGFDSRYFRNRPSGVKKSETLFGYSENVNNWAVVVESPLDVVRLASLGIPGIATYGSHVSVEQFKLLRGLDKVVFAMDNDEAGRASSKELLELSKQYGVESSYFHYGDIDVKDVGAMSKAEVLSGIKNARHMARGERAYL